MDRMAHVRNSAYFVEEQSITLTESGYTGAAIERLGRFEDICERLEAEQKEIAAQLETLRQQGKTRSVKFSQLLAKKLMNQQLLIMLEFTGVKTDA